MKRFISSVAALGILALTASLPVLAAEPPVLRVIAVQTADVAAYVHEVDVVKGLYKKAGQTVTIDVYRALYAGAEAGTVAVAITVPNLAALAKMNEISRTQPDVVAQMKKINAMRKIVSDSVYEKLSP